MSAFRTTWRLPLAAAFLVCACSEGAAGQASASPGLVQPQAGEEHSLGVRGEVRGSVRLRGKVRMPDGSPPPSPATIQIVCKGNRRPYGQTDAEGGFNIPLGWDSANSVGDATSAYSTGSPVEAEHAVTGGTAGRDLLSCTLIAVMSGLESTPLALNEHDLVGNADLGILVLHGSAGSAAGTFSMTTAYAPKDARREFEKGLDALRRERWDEAAPALRRSVEMYPRYTIAWEALGRALEAQGRPADARAAYLRAVEADPKFVQPYVGLMLLAGKERNWEEVLRRSTDVVRLDPTGYPIALLYASVSDFMLGRLEPAEAAARDGIKIDTQVRIPRLRQMLGRILVARGSNAEALDYLRAYLERDPAAPDAGETRGLIERASAAASPQTASKTQ